MQSPNGNIRRMDKLAAFLKQLTHDERIAFASGCNTSEAYLRKAISVKQALSEGLCLRISAMSNGAVTPEDLRQDVDWQGIRAGMNFISAPANTAQAATETVAGVANV